MTTQYAEEVETAKLTEHTPTPWRVIEESDYAAPMAKCEFAIEAADEMTIAVLVADQVPAHEANAAFIVKACNAHDKLEARIKELEVENQELRKHVVDLEHDLEASIRYCSEHHSAGGEV
jgi:hypothetical protein